MSLFGHDTTFFDIMEQQAEAGHRAATEFVALTQNFSKAAEYAERIKQIERDADELTHQLSTKADAKFITPFDKEDMHALSKALDDITDHIESAAARIVLYQLTEPRSDLAAFAQIVQQTTEATRQALPVLRNLKQKNMQTAFVRIHDLENQSDQAFRHAIADLFNSPGADPILVMKWKEVYDRIELTADTCEDIADILESIVVKYA